MMLIHIYNQLTNQPCKFSIHSMFEKKKIPSFFRALLFIGLIMVGCGTGGIKPCVATFGGDQFKLPQQKKQSELFFSIFYWAVNLGSFISMIVTPQLRSGVACLGEDYCYPLAFGVPAALMFVALLVFGIGRVIKLYKINMPDRSQENLIKKTLRCIWV